jgi:1,4-alpha-glucan branching enzyme
MRPQGHLSLVLHAHLPYVRHPEYDSFLEENWLFEALTETYIPLAQMLAGLQADTVPARLTLSLSPTLITMLRDSFLQERYLAHMDKMRLLAECEVNRTKGDSRFAGLARSYQKRLFDAVETFDTRYNRDMVAAFAGFQDAGLLEVITSAATHGYLPLLRTEPQAVRAQLTAGHQVYRSAFGHSAKGVWLPECGYYRGLEALVKDAGFGYFFVDTHAVAHASQQPKYGTTAPLVCPNGIAAFPRDTHSSRQVWSREDGYPGDVLYRDFYRDIGFDLDFDTIRPFILDGKTRIHTGFKYYRITGRGEVKEPYDPNRARQRLASHVQHFCASRRAAAAQAHRLSGPEAIAVAPYDAELFGHWWHEGVQWLDGVIRTLAADPVQVALSTPSDYLGANPTLQCAVPAASSWGDGGYNAFWLNPSNDQIYPRLDAALRAMRDLVHRHGDAEPGSLTHRALCQAARCLLLAQASDWPFIMKTGTSPDYAARRLHDHLARFHHLDQAIRAGAIDERTLMALEFMDNIFPEIDPALFA